MLKAASLLLLPALALGGQSLSDRFREVRPAWELALDKGEGASTRRAAEALLQREGASVSPTDYNEMHTLVAVMNMAARGCVSDGAWEEAVAHLQKAAASATENWTAADATLSKIRKQHEEKMAEWREALAKQEPRMKELDAREGLSAEQIKLRSQLHAFVDEHRNAIAHSERSLKEIEALLSQLKVEQERYARSLAEWQGFLAKEKLEIGQAGSTAKYVEEKLAQVKADEARPQAERLAYARRLMRLDPANADCKRFAKSLLGTEEEASAPPKPSRSKKRSPAKKKKG